MRRTIVIESGGDYYFNISSTNEFLIIRESDGNVIFSCDGFTPLELSRGDNVDVKKYSLARTRLHNPNEFDIAVEYQLSDTYIVVPPKIIGIDGSVNISSISDAISIQKIIEQVTVKTIENIVTVKGDVNVSNKLNVDVNNTVSVSGTVDIGSVVDVDIKNKQIEAQIINTNPLMVENNVSGNISSTKLLESHTFNNEKVTYLKLIANAGNKKPINFLGVDILAGTEFVLDASFVCSETITIVSGDSAILIKVG
ncbi:hypothetical protein WAX87_01775 [Photobacterium damselae subsp. damselae]|uniref:hypothetical protein n=1 Tax=Photobacterium damselae TaxID=38293 RepID=UPI000D083F09|nr:hypothetical protein [Photobacterium damselae]PSB82996.1 hypothetical protein C5F62_08605 [Photobacterium damselae subsp. damselae]TGZ34019.1 hypothetical protein EQ875_02585 [Photobacterium damselae subsp. damselae]